MNFKKYIKKHMYIILALTALLLLMAMISWNKNRNAGVIYLLIGGAQLILAIIFFLRIRKDEELHDLGEIFVQHNWFLIAFGTAGLVVYLSDFLAVEPRIITYMVFASSGITAVIGIYGLVRAVKDAGVDIVV